MKKISTYEAQPGEAKKVILLYSGGLDTSVLVKWIKENYKADVIALTVNLGQPRNFEKRRKQALDLGATKAYVIDAKDEFCKEYVARAIKANALYQGQYPLATALGRPLLSKLAVELAMKEKAGAIAHGCTGKGNDQVRIDSAVITLNPKMKIIAPVRHWGMDRDDEIEYAAKHDIHIPVTKKSPYSVDENLWGRATECGVLEDPNKEPPIEIFELVTPPEKCQDKPEYVALEFEKGIPVKLNGKKMKLSDLILELNKIGGRNGIGIIDMIEDRVIGLKSREIYEAPAALIIIEAHKDLEKFVSTNHENEFKPIIDAKFAYCVYSGLWYDPIMDELNAYIDKVNEKVNGTVKLKLYKGKAIVVGRKSGNAIYSYKLATYEKGSTFNQEAAPGFIELWSLQSKVARNIKK